MLRILRICLCLAALALIAPGALGAAESLFDKRTARNLTSTEVLMFGPEAGKYRYDSRMIQAAQIAQARANKRSTMKCWRYVKQALVAAGMVNSYPKTVYAKQAARELTGSYGFKKLRMRDPYRAPIGSVLVYGGRDAGHVEIRTARGYASDFISRRPYTQRPLIGIFIKPHA